MGLALTMVTATKTIAIIHTLYYTDLFTGKRKIRISRVAFSFYLVFVRFFIFFCSFFRSLNVKNEKNRGRFFHSVNVIFEKG